MKNLQPSSKHVKKRVGYLQAKKRKVVYQMGRQGFGFCLISTYFTKSYSTYFLDSGHQLYIPAGSKAL
jgi:hypothetical protein